MNLFKELFDTSDFPRRWDCGLWTPAQGWLHILSDLGVWSAYLAIPGVLGFFLLRKKDAPFRGVLWLFVAFILSCGATHLMEAVIFWSPSGVREPLEHRTPWITGQWPPRRIRPGRVCSVPGVSGDQSAGPRRRRQVLPRGP